MRRALFTFGLFTTCAAMAAGPGGPVPGYVLDSRTATVRAVYGIPGALQLNAAVNLPFGVISAGFGPTGDYVVAINDAKPAHAVVIQSLGSATPAVTDLGTVPDGTRVLAVNGTGSGVLLYAGDGSVIQFVTGLPQSPALSSGISTAPLAGPITAAVLDDAGACAIAGTGAIETLCTDGTSARILTQPNLNISALTLTNKGAALIYADRAGKQIVLLGQFQQTASTTVLAGASDGIDTPVGLQSLPSGVILAADAVASAVFVIDPTGRQQVQTIETNVAPTQLRFLSDHSILLLNDPSAILFTVMDLASMQTFFIPAN